MDIGADRIAGLQALRDRLAAEIDMSGGAAVAALSRELRATLAELERLGAGEEVTPLDERAARVEDELAARRRTPPASA